jgi:hypothetical protein
MEEDRHEFDLPPLQALAVALWALGVGAISRMLDLLCLLLRPRLLPAYFRLWLAEWVRSPYRWPRSFESVRALKSSGQTAREAMYGEAPLITALYLFRRAGLGAQSVLVDLGAGRGRPLLAARWLDAHASGVELLAHHVQAVAPALAGVGVQLQVGDAQEVDLHHATHVLLNWMGMSPRTRQRVTQRLLTARPGTRFIAVGVPVESSRARTQSRHRVLFTWGMADVHIQELLPG